MNTLGITSGISNSGFSSTLADLLLQQRHALLSVADVTAVAPSLISDIGDLQTDAASIPIASTAATAMQAALTSLNTALAVTPLTYTPALVTLVTAAQTAALQTAAVVAATAVNAGLGTLCNPPTAQSVSDFQQAWNALNSTFVISGLYDAATAAAIGTALGTAPSTCPTPLTPVVTPTPPVPMPTALLAPLARAVVADPTICNGLANANVLAFTTAYDAWAYATATFHLIPASIYDASVQTAIVAVLGANTAPSCSTAGGVIPAPVPVVPAPVPAPTPAAAATSMSGTTFAVIALGTAGVLGTVAYLIAKGAQDGKAVAPALLRNPRRRRRY